MWAQRSASLPQLDGHRLGESDAKTVRRSCWHGVCQCYFPRATLTSLCSSGHEGLKTMTHTRRAEASLMRRTHARTHATLPASLIRYTTVNILTQAYLELQLALAETTQTAHKSPQQLTEDTDRTSSLLTHTHSRTHSHTRTRRGELLWCAY